MNINQISRIDLNLLVVLQTLLQERHVGKTAARLNLSQSAVSHSLRRLRTLFNDKLFFRTASGIIPTERAQKLAVPLQEVLSGVQAIINPDNSFNPATATDRIVIGITDYASVVLMPVLAEYLEKNAPNLRISLKVEHPDLDIINLDSQDIDFSIAPIWNSVPKRISVVPLFQDRFVLVSRQGHPILSKKFGLEQLKSVRRIVVSSRLDESSVTEPAIIKAGFGHDITMTIPHFLAAPFVLEKTDHIAFLPERLSRHMCLLAALKTHEPPLQLPDVTMALLYHKKKIDSSPCLLWLSNVIKTVLEKK